jgi:hypothetical protein
LRARGRSVVIALAVEHRRRALAAATAAGRPSPACCKPSRAAWTVKVSRATPGEPRRPRPWRRSTHFCVGSETPRGMRNAGRALLCMSTATSHVLHACPRGNVAAQHATCHAKRSSSRLRSVRTQAQHAERVHVARACAQRSRVETGCPRAAATSPLGCRVERCGAAARRTHNRAFAACAAATRRFCHVHGEASYLCIRPACAPPKAQVRDMQRTRGAARCDARSAQMRTGGVGMLDTDVRQRSRAAYTRQRRAARLRQVQQSLAARRHMRRR